MSLLHPSKDYSSTQIPRSQSKSEQLARIIAESHDMQTSFRPDSQWSEGGLGSDVIWNGKKSYAADGSFIPPPLSSPAGQSTHTNLSSTSDSSYPYFSDAAEGGQGEDSWQSGNEGDTMFTTPEKATPVKSISSQSKSARPTAPAPVRPPRRVDQRNPPPGQIGDADEEGEDKDTADCMSVRSSVWAGRGRGNKHQEDAPPLPDGALLSRQSAHRGGGGEERSNSRQSAASSVYSQKTTFNGDESSPPSSMQERFPPNGIATGENDQTYREKKLADGTVIPRMPPIPSRFVSQNDDPSNGGVPLRASRSKKGRRNRSPILSYADGALEEERLVQERELREHGGVEATEITSRMGPRLKKNSPAPWEMGDDDCDGFPPHRPSADAPSLASTQGSEALKSATPSWARQSMDSLMSRNGSQQPNPPPPMPNAQLPSSLKPVPFPANKDSVASSPASDDASSRRSRSKSVSSNAVGMLKGLGLSSSAMPSSKKGGSTGSSTPSSGKIGKAFRGISSVRSVSNSSGSGLMAGKEGAKKMQGVSPQDYAHLDVDTEPALPSRSLTPDSRLGSSKSTNTIVTSIPSPSGGSPFAGTADKQRSESQIRSSDHKVSEKGGDMFDMLVTSNARKLGDQSVLIAPPMSSSASVQPVIKLDSPPRKHQPSSRTASISPSSHKQRTGAGEGESTRPEQRMSAAHKTSEESSASSTRLPASLPSVGSHEGVPYKLISLEQARQQQQKNLSSAKHPSTGIKQSPSSNSLEEVREGRDEVQPLRALRGKKSGLFRMFGKEKGEQVEEVVPTMPSAAFDLHHERVDEEIPGLRPGTNVKSLNAPALSIRPVSSMFNGLSPGLFDVTAAASSETSAPKSRTSAESRERLTVPQRPSAFLQSPELSSASSRASSPAYEDASQSTSTLPRQLPRRSMESTRSDTSSSLGLVGGFPATPSVQPSVDNSMALSTQDATALANSTRIRALEIEAKMAELLAELVKLRTSAADSGLLSPTLAKGELQSDVDAAASPGLGMNHANVSSNSLQPPSASSPSQSTSSPLLPVLTTAISPCSQCGCHCAEEKRLQALNEVALLKGVSVLERGRALKPMASGNVGKFGSYTHR